MNLTNSELFKSLLGFDFEGTNIDLHNDYTCILVKLGTSELCLFFRKDASTGYAIIKFDNVIINNMSLPLAIPQGLTLDNFHRCRYDFDGKLYDEYVEKKCFCLEFYEGGQIELLCSRLSFSIATSLSLNLV